VGQRFRFRWKTSCLLLAGCLLSVCAAFTHAADNQKQDPKLDCQFKAAVAEFDAGRFPEAAAELEILLPHAHNRFEVHEFRGLAYASQSQDYVHSGQKDQAQKELAIYQQLRTQHMAEIDKERAEVKQFVYSAKTQPSAKP